MKTQKKGKRAKSGASPHFRIAGRFPNRKAAPGNGRGLSAYVSRRRRAQQTCAQAEKTHKYLKFPLISGNRAQAGTSWPPTV